MNSVDYCARRRLVAGVILAIALQAALQQRAVAAPGKCKAGLLDLACEAGKTAVGKAGEIATAPVRAAAGGAVDVITSWVTEGATWLLAEVVKFIDNSTSPDLGAEWFLDRYRFMVGLAALVLVPILLMAAVRAIMNQDVSQLLKSFFVYLPLAILSTFVAVSLTQTLLVVTDWMSATVADGIAGDLSQIFDSVGKALGSVGGSNPAAPSFAIFFGALLLIIGTFFVWLELLIRSAAVTVSVFILPLMLAGLVWPATARWTRRLVETLVALILSKFVIVAVISLATAALSQPSDGGFGSVMGGAALMLMAAFSPMALLKLMPMAETAAMSHLEGIGRRPIRTMRPGGSVNQAASIMRSRIAGPSSQMAVAGASAVGARIPSSAVAATAAVAAGRAGAKPGKGPAAARERTTSPAQPPGVDTSSKQPTGGAVSDPATQPAPRRPNQAEDSRRG